MKQDTEAESRDQSAGMTKTAATREGERASSPHSLGDQVLLRTVSDGIVTLALNVPDKRNALTLALRETLLETLQRDEEDETVRAIVLTGGGGTFCSGGDIGLMGQGSEADARRRLGVLQQVVRLLVAGRKPVVTAVSGAAYGGGFSLALAGDYIVADPTARFSASFARVGLAGDMGLSWTLPQRVGRARSRQMLMDGRVLDANAARALGIVDEIAEPDRLIEAAHRLAAGASALAPLAIAASKRMLASGPSDLESLLAIEMEEQMRLFASRDHRQAREAFLARRQPEFTGR